MDYEKQVDKRNAENSEIISKRVLAVREHQLQRIIGTKLTCNTEIGPSKVRDFCKTDASVERLLKAAMQQLHLSARTYDGTLKLARATNDLAKLLCIREDRSKISPTQMQFV